jgi:hypothetical protein
VSGRRVPYRKRNRVPILVNLTPNNHSSYTHPMDKIVRQSHSKAPAATRDKGEGLRPPSSWQETTRSEEEEELHEASRPLRERP